ncbi:MAG: hypothetical protein ACRDNF_14995, partial [Streptosporangiaceae bacterium]
MSSRRAIALIAGAVTLLVGCLPAATASAAGQPSLTKSATHPLGNVALPGVVSAKPVSYTPNIFSGPACGKPCAKFSTPYASVVVNGEVVVAGIFGEACTPATVSYAECPANVTADDILAFNPATGAIDQDFNPTFNADATIYSLAAGPNNTVYVGGSFTTVDGTSEEGVAQLNVDPGQSNDGTLVPGFHAYTSGVVNAVAYDGADALYLGGVFSETDGVKTTPVSRVNATTGALDTSFKFTLAGANGGA